MPRPREKIRPQTLTNQRKHLRIARRMEPMAAVIDPQPLEVEASRVSPDGFALLDQGGDHVATRERERSTHAGGTTAEDDHAGHDDGPERKAMRES